MSEEFGSNPVQAFPGHGQMSPSNRRSRAFGAEVNKRAVLQRYQASAGFAEFLLEPVRYRLPTTERAFKDWRAASS
jgi:hypothetical protein